MRILIFNMGIADSEIFYRLRLTLSERNPKLWQAETLLDSLTDTNPVQSHHTDIPSLFHLWSTSHPISAAGTPGNKAFIKTRRDTLHNRFCGLTLYIYFCVWEYLEACSEGLLESLWNMRLLIMWDAGASCHTFHFFQASFFVLKTVYVHEQIFSSKIYWTFPHPQIQ